MCSISSAYGYKDKDLRLRPRLFPIYGECRLSADDPIAVTSFSGQKERMWYLLTKAALSGVLIAIISEVARRYPGFGGLIASLPLVSVLGMLWLWKDSPDPANMAAHAQATFWFVLPSLPMFLLIPAMLRQGIGFYVALTLGCVLTVVLYSFVLWAGPKLGLRL